jgi:hypothetical protein
LHDSRSYIYGEALRWTNLSYLVQDWKRNGRGTSWFPWPTDVIHWLRPERDEFNPRRVCKNDGLPDQPIQFYPESLMHVFGFVARHKTATELTKTGWHSLSRNDSSPEGWMSEQEGRQAKIPYSRWSQSWETLGSGPFSLVTPMTSCTRQRRGSASKLARIVILPKPASANLGGMALGRLIWCRGCLIQIGQHEKWDYLMDHLSRPSAQGPTKQPCFTRRSRWSK